MFKSTLTSLVLFLAVVLPMTAFCVLPQGGNAGSSMDPDGIQAQASSEALAFLHGNDAGPAMDPNG